MNKYTYEILFIYVLTKHYAVAIHSVYVLQFNVTK
jgi:hypothetical protein